MCRRNVHVDGSNLDIKCCWSSYEFGFLQEPVPVYLLHEQAAGKTAKSTCSMILILQGQGAEELCGYFKMH